MKPVRLLALVLMVGVLAALVLGPVMCIQALTREGGSVAQEIGREIRESIASVTSAVPGELSVSGPIDVEWKPGPEPRVSFSGSQRAVARARFDIKDGGIALWIDGSESRGRVVATVEGPQPKAIRLYGSGKARFDGLDADGVTVAIAGSGRADLGGRVETLTVDIAGSGTVDARKATVTHAVVSTAGSGDTLLGEVTSLKSSIAGSGDVSYDKATEVTSSVTGSGRVFAR